jgi:transposase-like protein
MSRQKRKFTPEERLSILQECDREGQSVTIRKYNLSPSLLQRWKQKYLAKGIAGLNPSYHRVDPEKRALEEENERLKKIVSKQALEIEFKTELLKHAQIDPLKKKR